MQSSDTCSKLPYLIVERDHGRGLDALRLRLRHRDRDRLLVVVQHVMHLRLRVREVVEGRLAVERLYEYNSEAANTSTVMFHGILKSSFSQQYFTVTNPSASLLRYYSFQNFRSSEKLRGCTPEPAATALPSEGAAAAEGA